MLESKYGLETLSYAQLRDELMCDDLHLLQDPYICVLLFEKVANQFSPAMTDREKSEHLIAKLPHLPKPTFWGKGEKGTSTTFVLELGRGHEAALTPRFVRN